MMIIRKRALEGLIVKYIKSGKVTTETIINGKVVYTEKKTIKELGYNDMNEYMEAVKKAGFEIVETNK